MMWLVTHNAICHRVLNQIYSLTITSQLETSPDFDVHTLKFLWAQTPPGHTVPVNGYLMFSGAIQHAKMALQTCMAMHCGSVAAEYTVLAVWY